MSQFEPKNKKGIQFNGLTKLKSWWGMVADNFEDLQNGVIGWTKSHSESAVIDHADGSVTEQKLSVELQETIENKIDKQLKTGSESEYKVLSDNNLDDDNFNLLDKAGQTGGVAKFDDTVKYINIATLSELNNIFDIQNIYLVRCVGDTFKLITYYVEALPGLLGGGNYYQIREDYTNLNPSYPQPEIKYFIRNFVDAGAPEWSNWTEISQNKTIGFLESLNTVDKTSIVNAINSLIPLKTFQTVEGGYAIKLTNRTGNNTVKGSIIQLDTANDNSFILATANSDFPCGVVYENNIANGSECWIVVSGIAEVLIKNTVAPVRGYVAFVSNTAGRADISAIAPVNEHWREIGHTLESKSAGTNVLMKCVLHFN